MKGMKGLKGAKDDKGGKGKKGDKGVKGKKGDKGVKGKRPRIPDEYQNWYNDLTTWGPAPGCCKNYNSPTGCNIPTCPYDAKCIICGGAHPAHLHHHIGEASRL
jgi:hypothetical protein